MTIGGLDSMLEDFKNGVNDFTKNGKCSECGECCSNILPMTKAEIETIKKYVQKNNIKEHKSGMFLRETALDMTCPFLNDCKTHRCNIYEVRPAICKNFSCCPSKRKPIPTSINAKPIDVRAEFFGHESIVDEILGML